MGLTTGRNKKTEPTLEYGSHLPIDVSSVDFKWNSLSTNAWFKIVASDDVYLNVWLMDEDEPASASANAALRGYLLFSKGEGSNAKVLKVYHDAGNTIGTNKIWAVR